MDKRTVLAFGLIAVVFFAWSYFFGPDPQPTTAVDSTAITSKTPTPQQTPILTDTAVAREPLPARYAPLASGANRYITVETPLYKAILNSRGGTLARFELKKYKTWYGAPVQLISDSPGFPGVLGIEYTSRDGKLVDTDNLNYSIEAPADLSLGVNDSIVVVARLDLAATGSSDASDSTNAADTTNTAADTNASSAGRIEKRFVFHGNTYAMGFSVAMQNMASEIGDGSYRVTWENGLKYQEHNSVDESSKAKVMIATGDEILTVDATSTDEPTRDTARGPIQWIGITSKYFVAALRPLTPLTDATVMVEGVNRPADSGGQVETYDVDVRLPYRDALQVQSFALLVGPLDYDLAKDFGVAEMVDFGWDFIVRPIGEYVMLPFFQFLHTFIGNFGIVIIVFSLVIRLLLWPLSIPQ
ncbi:MAG: membrane protein insertase YidC, partial [bacterium]|nr:membrane protein insertase YidC [Candidatus Kapabacteria bacterium]